MPDAKPRAVKRSYKDQRELDLLPGVIEALEAEIEQLQAALAEPDLYRDAPHKVAELNARHAQVEAELADAYSRWEALEGQ